MRVTLVICSGKLDGRKIVLRQLPFVIGRDPGCSLRPSHRAISKKHCALETSEGHLVLRDLQSTNGTMINGRLLRAGTIQIRDGDTVTIGPLAFVTRIATADPKVEPVEEFLVEPEPTPEEPEEPATPETDDTYEMSALAVDEDQLVQQLMESEVDEIDEVDEVEEEWSDAAQPEPAAPDTKPPLASDAADKLLQGYMRKLH